MVNYLTIAPVPLYLVHEREVLIEQNTLDDVSSGVIYQSE